MSTSSASISWAQAPGGVDPNSLSPLEIRATLNVKNLPTDLDLYFWALQVTFYDEEWNQLGGAHAGLQWNAAHPDNRAVNWGGYSDVTEEELDGTESLLPSTPGSENTFDYDWDTNTDYTFRIYSVGGGFWRAEVNGTTIRDLEVPDSAWISNPLNFSEVFSPCDADPVVVGWKDLEIDDDIDTYSFTYVGAYYSSEGCENTYSYTEDDEYFYLSTNATRWRSDGHPLSVLPLDRSLYVSPEPIPEIGCTDFRITLNSDTMPDEPFEMAVGGEFTQDDVDPGLFNSGFYLSLGKSASHGLYLSLYGFTLVEGDDPVLLEDGVNLDSSLVFTEFVDESNYYEFAWEADEDYEFHMERTGPTEWTVSVNEIEVATFDLPLAEEFIWNDSYVFSRGLDSTNPTKVYISDAIVDDIPSLVYSTFIAGVDPVQWDVYRQGSRLAVDLVSSHRPPRALRDDYAIINLAAQGILSLPAVGAIPLFSR